jgi:hypothetical protein
MGEGVFEAGVAGCAEEGWCCFVVGLGLFVFG